MLSQYFSQHFQDIPKPSGLSADEARQLIIDTHRLLATSRLIANGIPVSTEDENLEENLNRLVRLAHFLSAYAAFCEDLPEDEENTAQNLHSANFVAAQIFEFLAEYQVVRRGMTFVESGSNEPVLTGSEFWSDETRHWFNSTAHYLLAGHDGNAVTVIRRCRRLIHSDKERRAHPWVVEKEILIRHTIIVTKIVFLFLECEFTQVMKLMDKEYKQIWRKLVEQQKEFEIIDLVTISVLADIAQACLQISQSLTTCEENLPAKIWLDTINQAEQEARQIQDPALVWLCSLLRRLFGEFETRGLLFVRSPSLPSSNSRWLNYLQGRARDKHALIWPAHLQTLEKGYLDKETNAVVSMPPGSGKSFIAEIKIASIIETYYGEGWVLYIVPTNALARQVERDLQKALVPYIVPTQTDIRRFVTDREYNFLIDDEDLPESPVHYVAIMTPEKLRMALSLFPDSFNNCKLCVVDEAHLIEDTKRGALLELAISQLRTDFPKIKYLFLSAMMSNPEDLAGWLQGTPLIARWRPTRQAMMLGIPSKDIEKSSKEGIAGESDLYFASVYDANWEFSTEKLRLVALKDYAFFKKSSGGYKFLATETARNCAVASIKADFKTLMHLPHHNVETSATKLAKVIKLNTDSQKDILDLWERVLMRELGEDKIQLVESLREGVCYHKSSMHRAEQNLAEYSFKEIENVKIMVATSTLSQGMNLPVEMLIFAGDERHDPNTDVPVKITAKDFFNIAGRAGRPNFANQGIVQVIPNWKIPIDGDEEFFERQFKEIRNIYLAVSEDGFPVYSGLNHILDQIELAQTLDELPDDVAAVATAWFGRTEDQTLLRNTYAFYLALKKSDQSVDEKIKTISQNLANWIAKQKHNFPLSAIAEEAFRRSGLPSRTCRHLYQAAQLIFDNYSLDKLDNVSDENSFYTWFDLLLPFIQNRECEFFFTPRVKIGNTDLQEDFETVWQYEAAALKGWLQGNRISDLLLSDFVKEKEPKSKLDQSDKTTIVSQLSLLGFENIPTQERQKNIMRLRERAIKFMQRTTQQYAFAFSSLIFFLECVWREQDPENRDWKYRAKQLDLDWNPYLIHLPLAVKWGLDSLSSLVWQIQRVHFRFAARILGELYPIDNIDEGVRKRFGQLRSEFWRSYQDDPEIVVSSLKTRADTVGMNYEEGILGDVAIACFDRKINLIY